jgi:hypothetical protein
MPPPLFMSQEFKVPSVPPMPARKGPSISLLAGGGVMAVLAGVGLTLLWERQQTRPPLPPPTVVAQRGDVGAGQPVVEALPSTNQPAARVDAAAPPSAYPSRGAAPPLRGAGDEISPPPAPAPAAPPPVPAAAPPPAAPAPPPAAPAPAPGAMPSAAPPVQARPPVAPSAVAPAPMNPSAAPPQYTPPPAAQPTPPPPAAPQPVAPAPGGQRQTRDEIEELLGSGAQKPAAQPAAPPPQAAAPPPRPAPVPRPAASKPTPETTEAAGGEPAEKSSDQLLEEAQAAYVGGQRQRAIDMALQVTRRGNPNDSIRAWRFIGSAACSVRSATLATRAYNNLTAPEHRQLLTELCKRNGLNFNDGQFVAE